MFGFKNLPIIMRQIFRGFILGSSLPVTLWPLVGLGFKSRDLPAGTLDWFVIGLFFPVLFGVFNAITVALPYRLTWLKMLGIGALMGLVSASVGIFTMNIPEIVYGLLGNSRYIVLPLAAIFYGLIWAFPMHWINQLFMNKDDA